MTGNKKLRAALKSISPHSESFFGPAPILQGEDAAVYNLLLTRLYADLKPSDTIREIWLREIACWVWERWRWQRLKTCLIENAMTAAAVWVLATPPHLRLAFIGETKIAEKPEKPGSLANRRPPLPETRSERPSSRSILKAIKRKIAGGNPSAIEQAKNQLIEMSKELIAESRQLDETIKTRAFLEELDRVERIDREIAIAESRINATYREIERYNVSLCAAWREKVIAIKDAEFRIIDPKKPRGKKENKKNAA